MTFKMLIFQWLFDFKNHRDSREHSKWKKWVLKDHFNSHSGSPFDSSFCSFDSLESFCSHFVSWKHFLTYGGWTMPLVIGLRFFFGDKSTLRCQQPCPRTRWLGLLLSLKVSQGVQQQTVQWCHIHCQKQGRDIWASSHYWHDESHLFGQLLKRCERQGWSQAWGCQCRCFKTILWFTYTDEVKVDLKNLIDILQKDCLTLVAVIDEYWPTHESSLSLVWKERLDESTNISSWPTRLQRCFCNWKTSCQFHYKSSIQSLIDQVLPLKRSYCSKPRVVVGVRRLVQQPYYVYWGEEEFLSVEGGWGSTAWG